MDDVLQTIEDALRASGTITRAMRIADDSLDVTTIGGDHYLVTVTIP